MGEVKTVDKIDKKFYSAHPSDEIKKCKYMVTLTNKENEKITWLTPKDVSFLKPKTKMCVFSFFWSLKGTNQHYMQDCFCNLTDIYNTNYYIYK